MNWCYMYCEDINYIYEKFLNEDSKIDSKLILSRLDEILRCKSLIETNYLDKDTSYFLNNLEKAYAFERALHRLIEAILDICRHIVSVKRLGIPEKYSEYPKILEQNNLMNKELSKKLQKLAKLRNVLVHGYIEINYDILIQNSKEIVYEIVPKFIDWIRDLLKREESLMT